MQADHRAKKWNLIDPSVLWAPVRSLFPAPPAKILDVGAGSGRDAVWFAQLGYSITCVEPDRRLWPEAAEWIADELPAMEGVDGTFDLIVCCGVWHLVPEPQWSAALTRLAELAAADGRLIISLRLPPLKSALPMIACAGNFGWLFVSQSRQPSVQRGNRAAGVLWDWCIFDRVA